MSLSPAWNTDTIFNILRHVHCPIGFAIFTKSQIVTHFAGKFELSKKTVSSIIDEMAILATNETKKAGSFTFPGIGKLVLVKRKARGGRNPATGEPINIPAKTVVKMRVAKACKDAIVPPKK